MSSSVIRGGNLIVTEEGIRESVRQFMLPVWSTYYFFTLYANAANAANGLDKGATGYEARWRTDSRNVLDQYLLAKTGKLIEEVTRDLESFDSPLAAAKLRDFAEILTNWYVRRSRERFWSGTDTDAFDTLYTVLETVTRVAAPLAPLVTEEVWQGLTGGRSVHLEDWPLAELFPKNPSLVVAMDLVREVASAGLALRKAKGLRVRLPLARVTVVTADPQALAAFGEILGEELNVKEVELEPFDEGSLETYGITRRLSVNSRAAGPRIGKQVQVVIQAAKAGDWSQQGETVVVGGVELLEGEYDLELSAASDSTAIAFLPGGGFVLLDTELTPELEAEGLARDVIRVIQDTRKAAGLDVSDRIRLAIRGESEVDASALATFSETIAGETLSLEVTIDVVSDPESDAGASPESGSQHAIVAAGQYANQGQLVIDVWKSESA
jgi:isoleucyl-tRNA synthetase